MTERRKKNERIGAEPRAAFWKEVREAAKEYGEQYAKEEEEIHPHAKKHVYIKEYIEAYESFLAIVEGAGGPDGPYGEHPKYDRY
jgi:hypothetical protein